MSSWGKDQAEQETADQAEEERVAREGERWKAETARLRKAVDDGVCHQLDYRMPPYLFAGERSQRKAEAMDREERPWDDYSPVQNERLFR